MIKVSEVSASFTALLLFATPALATDPAQALFDQAKTLYADRADLTKVEEARKLLDEAEKVVVDSNLKYDILVLNARSIYFEGVRAKTDADKIKLFALGEAKAEEAKKVDDQYAEAYYVTALNIARWAQTKGAVASIGRKGDLTSNLEGAKLRVTRDLELGETIDGYGPDRITGRVLFELPAIFGGSRDKALKHLKICFDHADNYPINVHYYAEALAAGKKAEREEAKKILDALLKKDPKTLNPDRVPESEDEFKEARKFRAQLK